MEPLSEHFARMAVLAAGSRSGVRHAFAAPELIRPDQANRFGVVAPWIGLIVEVYVRNSDPSQCGDSRSYVQSDDFPRQLLLQGYAVRINDEQGTSGAKIESDDPRKNRRIFQSVLARIIAHDSHRIGVVELSRLARDESGLDPACIKKVVLEHCEGQILTLRKTFNLFDNSDSRRYDLDALMSGWRRQDDVEKSMEGFRRYIQDVVAGRREITMPHHASFGYMREPIKDPSTGSVVINTKGKVETRVVLNRELTEVMRAFRCAANVHQDASNVARELNAARLPGPDRTRPLGLQWTLHGIRRILRQDLYAGVWVPLRTIRSDEITTYLLRQGFDPRQQRRVEPGLAWFTLDELDNWRAKFIQTHKPISRRRKYDHPLLGILACADCSGRTGQTVYLTRSGRKPMSKTRGLQNIYCCPNRLTDVRCPYMIPEDAAFRVLATQVPAIQHRIADVITRIADCAASGNVIRIQQAIRAKQNRRQWIDENLIQPCLAASVRVDPRRVVEHARLGEEIDNLTLELDGFDAQTEGLKRATDVLRTLGGNLQEAMPQLNTHGRGVVYGALVTAAYLVATGRTHAKVHSVQRLTTVAETRAYHQDN